MGTHVRRFSKLLFCGACVRSFGSCCFWIPCEEVQVGCSCGNSQEAMFLACPVRRFRNLYFRIHCGEAVFSG